MPNFVCEIKPTPVEIHGLQLIFSYILNKILKSHLFRYACFMVTWISGHWYNCTSCMWVSIAVTVIFENILPSYAFVDSSMWITYCRVTDAVQRCFHTTQTKDCRFLPDLMTHLRDNNMGLNFRKQLKFDASKNHFFTCFLSIFQTWMCMFICFVVVIGKSENLLAEHNTMYILFCNSSNENLWCNVNLSCNLKASSSASYVLVSVVC